jgi:hypothetical protein
VHRGYPNGLNSTYQKLRRVIELSDYGFMPQDVPGGADRYAEHRASALEAFDRLTGKPISVKTTTHVIAVPAYVGKPECPDDAAASDDPAGSFKTDDAAEHIHDGCMRPDRLAAAWDNDGCADCLDRIMTAAMSASDAPTLQRQSRQRRSVGYCWTGSPSSTR